MRDEATPFPLPDWMEEAWSVRREGPAEALVRRDFRAVFDERGLIRAADVAPLHEGPPRGSDARPLRTDGGRGRLTVVPAGPLGEAVVRPYRRGGFPARFLSRRYVLGDRAFRELVVTERLRRRDVPAVECLAAVQSAASPGYRAALVTRRVEEADPAPRVLAGPAGGDATARRVEAPGSATDRVESRGPAAARRRDALRRMGRSTRRLHEAGGFHADLNAHNFLIPRGADADAVLLDFDRARLLPFALPGPLAGWNLRRLRRSLGKLGLDAALAEWGAFRQGYAP